MSKRSRKNTGPAGQLRARGRIPLTIEEITELDLALMEAFRTIQTLRKRFKAAKYIKFPPLPSIFSESIVIASVKHMFGPDWKARYGGKECDVLIENLTGEVKRIEVKATGENGFQEFKAKDLRADTLIWIRFGRWFQTGTGPIEIALLNQPSRFISTACRLDTVRFERRVGSIDNLRVVSFESLQGLLGINPVAGPPVIVSGP